MELLPNCRAPSVRDQIIPGSDMPLELNDQAAVRLKGLTQAYLSRAMVIGRAFVDVAELDMLKSADEKVLPRQGQLSDRLHAYIGERAFQTFIANELLGRFTGSNYSQGIDSPLTEYEGFEDPAAVAAILVEDFASLPWEYTLTVALPSAFNVLFQHDASPINISPFHRICLGSHFRASFSPVPNPTFAYLPPLGSENELAEWESDGVYFQMQCYGYVTIGGTETVSSAKDDFLAFLGLAIALKVITKPVWFFENLMSDLRETPTFFRFHKGRDGFWQHVASLRFDNYHDSRVRFLRPVQQGETPPLPWFASAMQRIGSAFTSTHGKRVKLAAKWLFESYCGRDSLQQFIQAAVALEILLGDEDAPKDLSLTALMANRCAYLVGKTPEDRAAVANQFREIYQVRGKIVHTGKSRLSSSDMKLFLALQKLCARVIEEELWLVHRSSGSGERLPESP